MKTNYAIAIFEGRGVSCIGNQRDCIRSHQPSSDEVVQKNAAVTHSGCGPTRNTDVVKLCTGIKPETSCWSIMFGLPLQELSASRLRDPQRVKVDERNCACNKPEISTGTPNKSHNSYKRKSPLVKLCQTLLGLVGCRKGAMTTGCFTVVPKTVQCAMTK